VETLLLSVEYSALFCDILTESHTHTTAFIICPKLLMHWADNEAVKCISFKSFRQPIPCTECSNRERTVTIFHTSFISSYLRPSRSHGTITNMTGKNKIRVIDVISTDVISFLARFCYIFVNIFRFRSSDDGVGSRQQIFLFRNKNV